MSDTENPMYEIAFLLLIVCQKMFQMHNKAKPSEESTDSAEDPNYYT